MNAKSLRTALVAGALVVLGGLALAGCSKDKLKTTRFTNVPPSVELTNAPVSADRSNPYFYAYRVNWSGNDPDGRIDHYEYCIDPTATDSVWIKTTKNEEIIFFRASVPDPVTGTVSPTASDFHVFVLKAVDDQGAQSARRTRAFYSYTIAPTVAILNPTPSKLLRAQVTPSVRIDWTGADADGQFSQKPVKYKYRMIELNTDNELYLAFPDSLRRLEASRNWVGWDSTSADTQFVQFTNLTPSKSYLFVVIGFDEAGAYNPVWDLNSNMLALTAGFASSNGPKIHIYNTYIDFAYASGGYTADPLREIPIEVPAGKPVTVNWDAEASPGSRIQAFRWMVDGNINDDAPRTDELNDYVHWSQSSPTMPNSVTLRGLDPGVHKFYLECADNNGQKSLGILKMTAVSPSFDRTLLVVDDTRLEVDKFSAGCPTNYTKPWPARAEFDTFMFARGGGTWRCTKQAGTFITPPGLLAGYAFDTLGTRLGLENPTNGVLLSRIGAYKNIIWLVDDQGSQYTENLDQGIFPVTALFSMSGPGRASTLAAYLQLGGRVWLAGGGAAYASLINFDRRTNNQGQTTVFANATGELVPSRIMYDGAHWRSSLGITKSGINTYRYDYTVYRGAGNTNPITYTVNPGWSHYNRFVNNNAGGTLTSPNYTKLPAEMRWKTPATDAIPPTRVTTASSLFYTTSFPCEYILSNNSILEDVDPDAEVTDERAVLDTLYQAQGVVLLTSPNRAPTMTYYHGSETNQFVFSGFSLWQYARPDCIALIDFVLQDIWGLTRTPVVRGTADLAGRNGAPPARRVVTPAQRSVSARQPLSGGTPE